MPDYKPTTPYYNTKNEGNYLDLMVNRPISKKASDPMFQINQVYHLRPDLLAYDLYEDSRLWWVFAQRNPNTLKDPLFDFTIGTEIFLPQLETLKNELGF